MPTYRVSYGWSNSASIRVPTFDDALREARKLLESETFEHGRERPTIANTLNEDYDTDGLSAEQREACEAIGLATRAP